MSNPKERREMSSSKRMISKDVLRSKKYLTLPKSAQALYPQLMLDTDDEGIVEAYEVIGAVRADESDLEVLEENGFIKLLNDEMVYYIVDFEIQNVNLRADRIKKSKYHELLSVGCQSADKCQPNITKLNITKPNLTKENIMSSKLDDDPNDGNEIAREVVEYLNKKTNQKYKATSKATKAKIKARLNECYTLDDFIVVIDKKASEWLNDEKMSKYLRPETLFGSKFENYLNQPVVKRSQEYAEAMPF